MKEHPQNKTVSTSIKQFNRQCAQKRAKINQHFNKYQKRVHNYMIDTTCVLGQGTFSTVYKGKDLLKARDVAIKVIEISRIEQTGIENLLKEQLNIVQRLNHPNIVTCLQYFRTANNCYTVYQFCQQGDLAQLLQKGHLGQKEDLRQANIYIKDVFQGLLYLENVNIVHRDIKAANIFLKQGKAKIGDFGFATRCNSQFRDMSIGSPAYMAPEGLIHSFYGPKTDVWAFGILIYQMVHGSTPFSECLSEVELKNRIKISINWDQLKTNLPSALKRLILKCLKVDSKQRPSFSQLLNDEYIRKLYNQTSIKRLNTKSSYSRYTSDTQKLCESTCISLMLQAIKKKDVIQTKRYIGQQSQQMTAQQMKQLKKELNSSEERLQKPQTGQNQDQNTCFQNQGAFFKEDEQIKQQDSGLKSQSKVIQLIKQEKVTLINHQMPSSNLQTKIQTLEILIQTIALQQLLSLGFSSSLLIYTLIQQLIKEIYWYCMTKELAQELQSVSLLHQKFRNLINDCELLDKAQISIKQCQSQLFKKIKQAQILIDKQDINLQLNFQMNIDSNTLILYANYLILSYKHLHCLESKQLNKIEGPNQKLQSSQQFYIWLYELELQKMDEL